MAVQTDAAPGTAVSSMQPVLSGGSDQSGALQIKRLVLPADNAALAALNAQLTAGVPMLYNELAATFDPQRGNTQKSLFISAARTTTQIGTLTNVNGRGLHVIINVTAIGTGSITVAIDAADSGSGQFYNLLTSAAIIANGMVVLRIYPGLTAVANLTANDVVPRTFKITVTANNANSVTYSVGYNILL